MPYPLVSVVVPVYKVEKYIEKCVVSIINQTYTNIELIIVNDCTPDESVITASNVLVREGYSKYTIVERDTNGGLSAARNSGLQIARGELILFIDSDDYLETDMIEKMVMPFENSTTDIVVCNYYRVKENSDIKEVQFKSPFVGLISSKQALVALLYFKEQAYIWRNVYRKKVFNDIQFAENVVYEDALTQPLLWSSANMICFIPDYLYNYVERTGSILNNLTNLTRYMDIDKFMHGNESIFMNHLTFNELYFDVVQFNYTWIRNLSLTVVQGNKPYRFSKQLLEKFSKHLKWRSLLEILGDKQYKLAMQLAVLKTSPFLFWKRFGN